MPSNCEETLKELVKVIEAHRTERYGSPPKGPFWAIDIKLYRAAGIM